MKQETLIQIVALVVLAGLALFINPFSESPEGKLIFFAIVIATVIFFIVFDIYNEIRENKIKIKLFNEKLNLIERIKNLENFKEIIENEK